MQIVETNIKDLIVIETSVYHDTRGFFLETYNKAAYSKLGINFEFLQDNLSLSKKNVLRGMHLQNPPFDQGKLVRVIKGSVLDVVIDLRKASPTYGQHFKIELNDRNNKALWVPSGFAHGFAALEDNTLFSYKCTNVYNKDSEVSILWNDPELGIDWEINDPIISEKDQQANLFRHFVSKF